MLKIKNLHVSISGKEILKGLNLEIKAGEVHAIMGPNGTGKSTLAMVITGKEGYEITEGEITYMGKDISGYSTEELIHMKSVDLASREDHEKIEEIVRNTRPDSEKPGEFTVWINRKDGSRRCILGRVTAAMLHITVSIYITITDITESIEREQALRNQIAALQKFIG